MNSARSSMVCSSIAASARRARRQFLDELNGKKMRIQRVWSALWVGLGIVALGSGDLRGPTAEDLADRRRDTGTPFTEGTVFRDCADVSADARAGAGDVRAGQLRRTDALPFEQARARRDHRLSIRGRPQRSDGRRVRGVRQGISARTQWLRHLRRRVARARRHQLAQRHAAAERLVPGDLRDLAGRRGLRRMAVAAHRRDLPTAERFGVGIPRAGRRRPCRGRTPPTPASTRTPPMPTAAARYPGWTAFACSDDYARDRAGGHVRAERVWPAPTRWAMCSSGCRTAGATTMRAHPPTARRARRQLQRARGARRLVVHARRRSCAPAIAIVSMPRIAATRWGSASSGRSRSNEHRTSFVLRSGVHAGRRGAA